MNAPALAEIIAEGKRLEEAYDSAVKRELDSEAHALWDERCVFWDEHGPRLLAVAEDAARFCDPAGEWLKLLDDPDKVSGALWTRMSEAREKLFAHFAPKPGDDAARGDE